MFYFLEATKANNNGSSRISKSSADGIETNDDSDNVDTGDTEDTTDDSDNEDDEDVALNKNKPDTPATKDPQSKLGGAERGKSSMESLIGSVFIKGVNKFCGTQYSEAPTRAKSHSPCWNCHLQILCCAKFCYKPLLSIYCAYSAANRSIGSTTGFHNHRDGPY